VKPYSIMNTLKEFHECAGLKANLAKSQVVFGGCSQELQKQCLEITELQESAFPMKYLGVPITAGRLSKTECRDLVNKILAKVQIWANSDHMLKVLLQAKGPKARKQITGTVVTTAIYNIWRARNQAIFNDHVIPTQSTITMIKQQVRHRISFMHSITKKYTMHNCT